MNFFEIYHGSDIDAIKTWIEKDIGPLDTIGKVAFMPSSKWMLKIQVVTKDYEVYQKSFPNNGTTNFSPT